MAVTELEIMTVDRDLWRTRAEVAEVLVEELTAQLRTRKRQVKTMLAFPGEKRKPEPLAGGG